MVSESQLFSRLLRIYFQQYIAIYCKTHVIARVYTGFVVTLGPVATCEILYYSHIGPYIGLLIANK